MREGRHLSERRNPISDWSMLSLVREKNIIEQKNELSSTQLNVSRSALLVCDIDEAENQ
jgi:hypothetical protein